MKKGGLNQTQFKFNGRPVHFFASTKSEPHNVQPSDQNCFEKANGRADDRLVTAFQKQGPDPQAVLIIYSL